MRHLVRVLAVRELTMLQSMEDTGYCIHESSSTLHPNGRAFEIELSEPILPFAWGQRIMLIRPDPNSKRELIDIVLNSPRRSWGQVHRLAANARLGAPSLRSGHSVAYSEW